MIDPRIRMMIRFSPCDEGLAGDSRDGETELGSKLIIR